MQLSTMTNLFYVNTPDGLGYLRSVEKTAEIGFLRQDFSMCPMQRGESELCLDGWEEKAERIALRAEELGVTFGQSHLPYAKVVYRRKSSSDPICEENRYFMEMTERTIRISAMLGVKWAIVHPVQQLDRQEYGRKADLEYNRYIYDKWIELANSLGVGLAFENMADVDARRRFGVTADDLLDLMEEFRGANVGICYDFGHGNREFTSEGQIAFLKAVSPYLVATHVNDNYGQTKDDAHTVPFIGTVKWKTIMPLLKEIGYTGDFNFELSTCSRMPEELKVPTAQYIYTVGKYLVDLYDKA